MPRTSWPSFRLNNCVSNHETHPHTPHRPAVRAAASLHAAEPWWHEYTPVATVGLRAESLETIQPGAACGVGTLGWYGFWFLDAQEQAGYCEAGTGKLRHAGVKRIVYYDLGEVGDYAAFFTADGKMKHNGWSLPSWDGKEPLTARWLGLEAFLRECRGRRSPARRLTVCRRSRRPTASPRTTSTPCSPGAGSTASGATITPAIPASPTTSPNSGLAKLSGQQSGPADTQGESGWQMVRLVDVDYANPQMRDYVCREIEHIIPKLRPDGIHADNLSGSSNASSPTTVLRAIPSRTRPPSFPVRPFSCSAIVTSGHPCPALNAGSAVSRLTRYNVYACQACRWPRRAREGTKRGFPSCGSSRSCGQHECRAPSA